MRRLFLICVLGGLAVAASALVPAGSARGHSSAAVLLSTNDRLEVAGSKIACRVTRKGPRYSNRLACYRETASQSYSPVAGSYALELAEGGVGVVQIGGKKPAFSRSELPPPGAPAGADQATALLGGFAHLRTRSDKAFIEGTNIVCRPYSQRTPALLCVLLGKDGHIHDGTYLAWISDRGVLVAQARKGSAVVVFQRTHGR
jgi:hypothetical protein